MRPSNEFVRCFAMAHRIVKTEDFHRNLKRLPWKSAYTGEIKAESILGLMDEAREF